MGIDGDRARGFTGRIIDLLAGGETHVDVFVEASRSRIVRIGVGRQIGFGLRRRCGSGDRAKPSEMKQGLVSPSPGSAEIARLATRSGENFARHHGRPRPDKHFVSIFENKNGEIGTNAFASRLELSKRSRFQPPAR